MRGSSLEDRGNDIDNEEEDDSEGGDEDDGDEGCWTKMMRRVSVGQL